MTTVTIFTTRPASIRLSPTHQPGVSNDATRIGELFDALATHWLNSATGQTRFADPRAALIQLYEDCRRDNWDNEGARAISAFALIEAERLLDVLPSFVPIPEFLPEPTGAIAFEWYLGTDRIYVLSVVGRNSIEFAGLLGAGNEVHGRANFVDALPALVAANLQSLLER